MDRIILCGGTDLTLYHLHFCFVILLSFSFRDSYGFWTRDKWSLLAVFIMANSCLQLGGFLLSFLGWLGIVIATSTTDWVNICKYGLNTCKKMDELEARGPWAHCVISTGLYHCVSLTQILDLPGRHCSVYVVWTAQCLFIHAELFSSLELMRFVTPYFWH